MIYWGKRRADDTGRCGTCPLNFDGRSRVRVQAFRLGAIKKWLRSVDSLMVWAKTSSAIMHNAYTLISKLLRTRVFTPRLASARPRIQARPSASRRALALDSHIRVVAFARECIALGHKTQAESWVCVFSYASWACVCVGPEQARRCRRRRRQVCTSVFSTGTNTLRCTHIYLHVKVRPCAHVAVCMRACASPVVLTQVLPLTTARSSQWPWSGTRCRLLNTNQTPPGTEGGQRTAVRLTSSLSPAQFTGLTNHGELNNDELLITYCTRCTSYYYEDICAV